MTDFELAYLQSEFERLAPGNGDALLELAWVRKKRVELSSWLQSAYKIRARLVKGDMSDLECQDFKEIKKRARGE
jgi:hypothetical protein